jgi:hypothetical protein
MSRRGDVTYEKDILSAVEEKLPEFFPETIAGVWKFIKKELTKKCNDPDIGAIFVPSIGIMYRNLFVVNTQIRELEYIQKYRRKDVKKKLAYLRKIKRKLDDLIGDEKSIHKTRNNFYSLYLRKGMESDEELENYQNHGKY